MFLIRRYIYAFPIDYELAELYETYMAADKYLLHHFNKAFFGYITTKLTAESCCLIYDQLMKIGEHEELSLASVRTVIIEGSEATFKSDHFTQIDQETLISLLSLDELSIDEFDLLTAVSRWVDCEVQRQGLPANREKRQKVFEPIKSYILFTALTPEKFASCKEITELLTLEERGSLALHFLCEDNPSMIELKTSRKVGVAKHFSDFIREKTLLTPNRRVSLRTIYTINSGRGENLCLQILDSNGKDFGLKIESSVQNGRLCFSIKPPFVMEGAQCYTLQVTGYGKATDQKIKSNYRDSVTFSLCNYSKTHCVRGLEFFLNE